MASKSTSRAVHTQPQKDFFVSMITRDISTRSCVLDLIDNAIDGARRASTKKRKGEPFVIDLRFSSAAFSIEDNCGGIDVETAAEYAFHFGRRRNADLAEHGIGMYGIGMKRAIFKLGREILVTSSTSKDAFEMVIDVDKWLALPDTEWDFRLQVLMPIETPGTKIQVKKLNPGVGAELADNFFVSDLKRTISKVYSKFLTDGFVIKVNRTPIEPYRFELRLSDTIKPLRKTMRVGNVDVKITAGLGALPPEDDSAEYRIPHIDHFGWYVLCNDRIVLAGDKGPRTGWGTDGFTSWHPQYGGFVGIVEFSSEDPLSLPWGTTKSDLDDSNVVYRRALTEMKKAAQRYVDYTSARKTRLKQAKKFEGETASTPLEKLVDNEEMSLPVLSKKNARVEISNIKYAMPKSRVTKVARALGRSSMSAKQVGIETFEYYYSREVGK